MCNVISVTCNLILCNLLSSRFASGRTCCTTSWKTPHRASLPQPTAWCPVRGPWNDTFFQTLHNIAHPMKMQTKMWKKSWDWKKLRNKINKILDNKNYLELWQLWRWWWKKNIRALMSGMVSLENGVEKCHSGSILRGPCKHHGPAAHLAFGRPWPLESPVKAEQTIPRLDQIHANTEEKFGGFFRNFP